MMETWNSDSNNVSSNDINNNITNNTKNKKDHRPLLGVSVHHLCTIFQPEVMVYVSQVLKRDCSDGITIYDIEPQQHDEDDVLEYEHEYEYNKNNNNKDNHIPSAGGYIRQKSSHLRDIEDDELGTSYVNTLNGIDHVGVVTHMLSYTWGNTIDDITQSLMGFCERRYLNTKRTYIWLCCLCTNQHRRRKNPLLLKKDDNTNYMSNCIERQLVEIKNVISLLTMAPPKSLSSSNSSSTRRSLSSNTTSKSVYKNLNESTKSNLNKINNEIIAGNNDGGYVVPLYLNRVWCIYELYVAITQKECNLEIIMPPTEKEKIMDAIRKTGTNDVSQKYNILYTLLSYNNTKIEYAHTSNPEDKEMILRFIQSSANKNNSNNNNNDSNGCTHVNDTVNAYMRTWIDEVMIKEAIELVEKDSKNNTNNNNSNSSKNNAKFKNGTIMGGGDSTTDVDLGVLYNNIGLVYNNTIDMHERALYYFQKSRSIHERITAVTYSNIGDTLVKGEDYNTALMYYHQCMEIRQREYGVHDPSTAMTYNNLSSVYYKIGDYDKSLEYSQKCSGIWEQVYSNEADMNSDDDDDHSSEEGDHVAQQDVQLHPASLYSSSSWDDDYYYYINNDPHEYNNNHAATMPPHLQREDSFKNYGMKFA